MNEYFTNKEWEWLNNLDYLGFVLDSKKSYQQLDISNITIWFMNNRATIETDIFHDPYDNDIVELSLEEALQFQEYLNESIELMKEYESLEDNT